MSARKITAEQIEEARAQIERVVSSAIVLKRQAGLRVGLCPFHSEKTHSFTLYDDHYHCFGCGAHGDAIDFVREPQGLDFKEAVEWILGRTPTDSPAGGTFRRETPDCEPDKDAERKRALALEIWRASKPAAASYAETYLRSRGITIPVPPSLRCHSALKHSPTGQHFPAMVAGVQGPDGKMIGIHRTWLKRDGAGKAVVSTPKMTLGSIKGGAVRFAPAGETLAVAEGIENALSVQQSTGIPAWAALSAGGIENLELPNLPTASEMIICGDHDKNGTGQKAAETAAQRWHAEGRKVRIAVPPIVGDFNDLLRMPANVLVLGGGQ